MKTTGLAVIAALTMFSAPSAFASSNSLQISGSDYPVVAFDGPSVSLDVTESSPNSSYPGSNLTRNFSGRAGAGVADVAIAVSADKLTGGQGTIYGRIDDRFSIFAPGFEGQEGVLTARIHTTHVFETSITVPHPTHTGANASFDLQVSAKPDHFTGTGFHINAWEDILYFAEGPFAGVTQTSRLTLDNIEITPGQSLFELEIPVIVGTGVYLWLHTGVSASATANLQLASAEASGTMRWLGMSLAIDGQDVPYSLTSTSGFDWSQAAPVPEADTWAMLVVGLGLVGWRASRRAPKVLSA